MASDKEIAVAAVALALGAPRDEAARIASFMVDTGRARDLSTESLLRDVLVEHDSGRWSR